MRFLFGKRKQVGVRCVGSSLDEWHSVAFIFHFSILFSSIFFFIFFFFVLFFSFFPPFFPSRTLLSEVNNSQHQNIKTPTTPIIKRERERDKNKIREV